MRLKSKGFTLIELLVVIAIIALLMGILVPAVGTAKEAAKRARARNDVDEIVNAWKAYLQDNRKYPSQNVSLMDAATLSILTVSSNNPYGSAYLEATEEETLKGFLDQWGDNVYHVRIDNGIGDDPDAYSGTVPDPYDGSVLTKTAIAWSWGKDGKFNTSDDIKSW